MDGPFVLDPDDPVPTCPLCHGLLRRRTFEDEGTLLICDTHGKITPEWVYVESEEEREE